MVTYDFDNRRVYGFCQKYIPAHKSEICQRFKMVNNKKVLDTDVDFVGNFLSLTFKEVKQYIDTLYIKRGHL